MTLLERKKLGEDGKWTHPHGWAIILAGQTVMHYMVDTESLCGNAVGYVGICYPAWDPEYFEPIPVTRCSDCHQKLEETSTTP